MMLKYNDIVQFLADNGLNCNYIAEITGLSEKYIYNNYKLIKTCKQKPPANIIAIAKKKIEKSKNFIEIVKLFQDYDINVIYSNLSSSYIKIDVIEAFFRDASKLLSVGLSLSQVCEILQCANDNILPDRSSLRKALIKRGIYESKDFLKMGNKSISIKDKKIILLYIKKYKLSLNIEDFIKLRFKFREIHATKLFDLLKHSKVYTVKKCNCCKKEILSKDKFSILCPSCKSKSNYEAI
jgi:hypothetical protein